MGLFGIKAGFLKNPAAFKAEMLTVEKVAKGLTKAELLAANPGPGLEKFSKACLVMRAITLHMTKWEEANS